MKRNKPQITIEDNTVFLTLDLKGLGLYDRAKAIRQFVNDTKIVQDYVDELVKGILDRNGIILLGTDKSALERAFDSLNAKGKDIKVINFYGGRLIDDCRYVDTKNDITVVLEGNRYLQAAVKVEEITI